MAEAAPVTSSPYQLKRDPYSSHSVILSRLGEGRGRRALDVAAADGFLSELLTRQGWTVTALERDPEQAARARGRCKEVIVADLEDPLGDMGGPFDAIVCGDVLEHLREPLAALLTLKAKLTPDGVIVISVPNVAHLWMRLSLLAGHFNYTDRGLLDRTHLRFFTRRTLLDFLREAGLSVTELTVTPVPLPLVVPARYHGGWLRTAHAINALATRCWKSGLAYQFVAVCRPAGGR